VALTPLAIAMSLRLRILDRPGALKRQSTPVPYLGGTAVLAGLAVGIGVGKPLLAVPLVGAVAIGILDDRLQVSPGLRLVGQVLVGVTIALIVPIRLSGPGRYAAVTAAAVLLMNGVNFIDGLDGLAPGVVAVSAGTFAVLLHGPGRVVALAMAFATAGFLLYNRPPARVYLGDGGSYLLGATLTVLVAWAWAPHVRLAVGGASLLAVALPVFEVAAAVLRRVRGRTSLVEGDRRHPYDQIVSFGHSPGTAAWAYVLVQLLLGAAALLVVHAPSVVEVVVLVAAVAALVGAAGVLGSLSPAEPVQP
jgi:UDP-GlcNAc:undecaprenyl-phosphate/decaprenyl-phosphate GlcNAc-1-phosphate transferase